MHRLAAVKEALPCGLRNVIGQGSPAFAAIEGVVAIPERFPSGEVGGLDGADGDVGWHGVAGVRGAYYYYDSALRRFYAG